MKNDTGHDATFGSQIERELPGLAAFLRRRLGRGERWRDAVQETVLRAWRFRSGFQRDRRLGSWLLAIGSHVADDFVARDRRASEQHRESPEEWLARTTEGELHGTIADRAIDLEPQDQRALDPSQQAELRDQMLVLEEELDRLPEVPREVFQRFYRRGQSIAEIAQELTLPVNTVKSHLRRARRRLAERLEQPGRASRVDPVKQRQPEERHELPPS